ncbi:MAG: DUF421 domain-containing protein [Sphingomonas bacterium]
MIDWLHQIIGPDDASGSIAQFCARATILFVFGLLCIRIAGRRTFSDLSPLDIIVSIVVGSNISRTMTGRAPFIQTLAATLLLVLLHRLVALATVRSNLLSLFAKGRPAVLVRDGKLHGQAMLRHGISEQDLMEGLRMEQVDAIEDVALATIERGGKISVVPKRPENQA